jgi:hypothetical protein
MASLKTELGSVKLPALNRERLIEFGRKTRQAGCWARDVGDRYVFQRLRDLNVNRAASTKASAKRSLEALMPSTTEIGGRFAKMGSNRGDVTSVGSELILSDSNGSRPSAAK